jgi:phospho-N-acetylmuramoyl-pentapeptide-transferase
MDSQQVLSDICLNVGILLSFLNIIFSNYLNIMYIPNSGDDGVYSRVCWVIIGFLWYNYPASVFMGDTGSLDHGGIIAVLAIAVRKELLIPLLCGVF